MDSIINDYSNMLQTLMSNSRLTFDDSLHGSLPQEGGVYRIFEKEVTRSSVYVGKTGNLRARVYQDHFMGNRESSILKKRLIATGRFANENAVKPLIRSFSGSAFELKTPWFQGFFAASKFPARFALVKNRTGKAIIDQYFAIRLKTRHSGDLFQIIQKTAIKMSESRGQRVSP